MAIWAVRTGRGGEHEQRFLDDGRVYATWDRLRSDLSQIASKAALGAVLAGAYSGWGSRTIGNHAGQLWRFAHEMEPGDLLLAPAWRRPRIHVAEIASPYGFDPDAEPPYFHSRAIRWIGTDVPRPNFDQDIRNTLCASMTIFRVERNNAENRIRGMAANQWQSGLSVPDPGSQAAGPCTAR